MLVTILIVFAACFVLERLKPGWRLPHVRTWPLRVLLVNAVQLGVVLLAGVTWERWLSSGSLLHLSRYLGPVAGGMLAYFIATFVFYCGTGCATNPTSCGACSTRSTTARAASKSSPRSTSTRPRWS